MGTIMNNTREVIAMFVWDFRQKGNAANGGGGGGKSQILSKKFDSTDCVFHYLYIYRNKYIT